MVDPIMRTLANPNKAQFAAEALKSLATPDRNPVLLTEHASSNLFAQQIFLPANDQTLPDHDADIVGIKQVLEIGTHPLNLRL